MIVYPPDWSCHQRQDLAVVASGSFDGSEMFKLIERALWILGHRHDASAPDPVPLRVKTDGYASGYFPDIGALSGRYIIALYRGADELLAASGVTFGRSMFTDVRMVSAAGDSACAPRVPAFQYPLTMVDSEYSGIKVGGPAILPALIGVEEVFLAGPSNGNSVSIGIIDGSSSYDALPNLVQDLCKGNELTAFKELVSIAKWNTAPQYFAVFADGIADLANGIVFTREGEAWGDSCVGSLVGNPEAVNMNDYLSLDGKLMWIGTGLQYRSTNKRPKMVFSHFASLRNHAHWLMNSLYAVFSVLPYLQNGSIELICAPLSESKRDVLLRMGVPAHAITETSAPYACCEKLIFPSHLSTRANMHPTLTCKEFFDHLRSSFYREYTEPMPELIVLTRMGFGGARKIVNESELVAVLRGHGFCSVAPHELSMEQEVNVFSRAKIVVCQLGAALSNMAFMPADCTIVELCSSEYTSNEYLYMANLLGHKYVRLLYEPLLEDYHGPSAHKFLIPIEDVVAVIVAIIHPPGSDYPVRPEG